MQIHELNDFNGDLTDSFFATDDGSDTGKVRKGEILREVTEGLGLVNERIDNLLNGVTQDSEVIDARVGADGNIYGSLGSAIRSQISNLQNEITDFYGAIIHNPSTNYINKNTLLSNMRISTTTGQPVSQGATGLYASDFIPVEPGDVFYYGSDVYDLYYAYYDASKTFLSSAVDYDSQRPNPFTVPAGAYYLRVTLQGLSTAWINKKNEVPSDYALMFVPSAPFIGGVGEVLDNTNWDDTIPSAIHDPNTNYIDMDKVTTGYISGNGNYVSYADLYCTDYIPMEEGVTYYRGAGIYSGKYYGFYDADKNVVAAGNGLGNLSQSFTIPAGAVYGRFTILQDATPGNTWIFTQNGRPSPFAMIYYFGDKMNSAVRHAFSGESNPTEYNGGDIQAFDTGICIGDSLTIGVFNYDNNGSTSYETIPEMSYPAALQRMTGIEITNAGESGATSKEWYSSHQNNDLSGHKFAIIQFGVNDVIRYGQGWTQDSEDGYTSIINKLKTDNQKIKIFVSTVMPAISYPPANYETFNAGLISFVEGLNDTDVIVLDLATYGNTEAAQYNAGHLSAYGYWRLAKDYINYISWYMGNNGLQFREIQFIGTNKHY